VKTNPGIFIKDDAIQTLPANLSEMERTLGEALREFASELRLADAADFAAFIRIGHIANLRAIVRSAAELYFKPGTLDLAELGELELGWLSPPLVTLPMTFRHRGLRVYFCLRLAALSAAVEVESIGAGDPSTVDLHGALREALDEARIVRAAPQRA
jgi:hypothetical protein